MSDPIDVVSDGERTRVILPMPLPYLPVPTTSGTLLDLVLVPIWMICFSLICWLGRIKPPPRAVFVVDNEQFKIEFVARDTGNRTGFECNRKDIVELRKNRYGKGLWIHARGKAMTTFLQDIDDDTILKVAEVLRSRLEPPTPVQHATTTEN